MWVLLSALALGAPPAWKEAPGDVIVEATLPGSPEALYGALSDLRTLAALYPTDCTPEWETTGATSGPEARTRVTWRLGLWQRKLTAVYGKMVPGRLVQLDHQGNKGFVTQWVLDAVDGGTHVTMGTYIAPPPWPFKRTYVFHVQPAWADCQARVLQALTRFR